jgi:hypothetical protein
VDHQKKTRWEKSQKAWQWKKAEADQMMITLAISGRGFPAVRRQLDRKQTGMPPDEVPPTGGALGHAQTLNKP